MSESYKGNSGPLVSILLPTYNRRRYLPVALNSVVHQDYENLEIFVIRDGGDEVRDIVESFDDSRIIFIDRKENRGKAYSLNQALSKAKGYYIAYLDDDDLYYPEHISILVDALEHKTDCHAAYSDLYKTKCRVDGEGNRQILGKVVDVSRDFDRFVMLYFNHILHVSLMHRSDLLLKTGFYNEDIQVLIDWDLIRRISFFTDFYHVHEVTGEFYSPVGDCDRVSVQRRKDKDKYLQTVLSIRTSRPPKPWSKIKDMSIIFVSDKFDKDTAKVLCSMWRHTFYPYEVYLPLPESSLRRLNCEMPNIVYVPVAEGLSDCERIDAALSKCEGYYIAVVPDGFSIRDFWVEDCLHALINNSSLDGRECFELEGSSEELWAVVACREDMEYARRQFGHLPLRESLQACGVRIRQLEPDEIPFQFDQLLSEARSAEVKGDWAKASGIFDYILENYDNELWIKSLAARALFHCGDIKRATELSSEVNRQRPTVDTLLLEAKAARKQNNVSSAIELLEKAEQILKGRELVWT